MVTPALKEQIAQLDTEDRFELVRYIHDLAEQEIVVAPEMLDRANSRLDDMLSGKVEPITADDMMARVRARIAARHS
jgi:hypothetical protein